MISDAEARIRRIEEDIQWIERALDGLGSQAGSVAHQILAFREASYTSLAGGSSTVSVAVKVTRSCDPTPITGALVQALQGGVVVASGSTDTNGLITLALPQTGATTIDASALNYAAGSTNLVVNSGPPTSVTIALAADVNHACCSACPDLLPATLTLSDALGSIALVWNSTRSAWEGCRSATRPGVAQGNNGIGCGATEIVTTIQMYQLFCDGAHPTWSLLMSYPCCFDITSPSYLLPFPSACQTPVLPGGCLETNTPLTQSCTPLNLTYQIINTTFFGANGSSVVITA